MKIKIFCDNGAHHRSHRSEEIDTNKDLGYETDEAWNALTEAQRYSMVEDWIKGEGWIEIWYEPVE